MSRGFPSMTALLGLLAIAGYQNRDKIAEMLGGLWKEHDRSCRGKWARRLARPAEKQSWRGWSRRGPSGGLAEIVDRFKNSGQGETAESTGRNGPQQTGHAGSARAGHWPRGAGPLCQNKQDCRGTSCSRGCRASFPPQSINTRRTADFPRKQNFRVPKG